MYLQHRAILREGVSEPKGETVLALLELHLFLKREIHGLRAHFEHVAYFIVDPMVLQAGTSR